MADNSSRKFKFISPGVYIDEIDNSQLPDIAGAVGPVVIGTARKGPGMVPVQVSSFSEFVSTFGNPIPGSEPGDYWREGNTSAPTYGAYAAQAWLRNSSPLTYVRLLGEQSSDATAAGKAGWKAGTANSTVTGGGAWGLFVFPSGTLETTNGSTGGSTVTGSLAATFYAPEGRMYIQGTRTDGATTGSCCEMYEMTNKELTLGFSPDGTAASGKTVKISLDPNQPNYLRNVLNTNPSLTNDDITSTTAQAAAQGGEYWLGETFERSLLADASGSLGVLGSSIDSSAHVVVWPMLNGGAGTEQQSNFQFGAQNSTTGWFISQDLGVAANYEPKNMQKLFRCVSLTPGEWAQQEIKISITNIRAPRGDFEEYGTFSLVIRKLSDTDSVPLVLERYDGLTLNPASANYIAKMVGDKYEVYDSSIAGNREYGQYANNSVYIRVDMDEDVDRGSTDSRLLPFGMFGPPKYRGVTVCSGSTSFGRQAANTLPSIELPAAADMVDGGGASVFGRLGGHGQDAAPNMVLSLGNQPAAAAATCTVTIAGFASLLTGDTITLLDSYGVDHVFTIDKTVATVTGRTIGTNGAGSDNAVATRFYEAIIDTTGNSANGKITAASPGANIVTITQVQVGVDGVQTNVEALTGVANVLTNFVGGVNKIQFSGSINFPTVPLRKQSTWGNPKDNGSVYWGAWTGRTPTDPTYTYQIQDMVRPRCSGLETSPAGTTHDLPMVSQSLSTSDPVQLSWVFSLDNVSGTLNSSFEAQSGGWNGAYRPAGTSLSAVYSYTGTLAAGYDQFTTLLHGGIDGFDITERDPFRLSTAFDAATDEKDSYPLFSLKKAINIISDAEVVQMNAATIPGVTQNAVTNYLLDAVEDRGDSLALIDIQKVYTPDTANAESAQSRNSFTVKQAVDALVDRNINTSYGATYYPWVLINDSISGRTLWAPPSVVALGALSNTDKIAAPWFAPAGFARGGLSEGGGGVPVLDVSKRLTSADRDSLYEANINPIAKFPAEGIVIFGQKTLQQTASALDRINVRRLLIYLKREISFIASRLLFAPNTQDTWMRFTQQASPVLRDVQSQFGIEDFKLILDESTTTPDLIDRNIIYAKLLVKPTRAAEFFAIDFVVTNSGASFED
jgi:hypothetical protein